MWLPFPVFLYKRVKQGQKDGKTSFSMGRRKRKKQLTTLLTNKKQNDYEKDFNDDHGNRHRNGCKRTELQHRHFVHHQGHLRKPNDNPS